MSIVVVASEPCIHGHIVYAADGADGQEDPDIDGIPVGIVDEEQPLPQEEEAPLEVVVGFGRRGYSLYPSEYALNQPRWPECYTESLLTDPHIGTTGKVYDVQGQRCRVDDDDDDGVHDSHRLCLVVPRYGCLYPPALYRYSTLFCYVVFPMYRSLQTYDRGGPLLVIGRGLGLPFPQFKHTMTASPSNPTLNFMQVVAPSLPASSSLSRTPNSVQRARQVT